MSGAHIDWFEKDGIKFCAIIDDASRKVLAAGEFENANTANSIALIDKLVEGYWDIHSANERNHFRQQIVSLFCFIIIAQFKEHLNEFNSLF